MYYTLGQAAKATGKTKPTIANAIKKGRLSAQKNDIGEYQIDAAELSRVYPLLQVQSYQKSDDTKPTSDTPLLLKIERLEATLEAVTRERDKLTADVADARAERDEWRDEAKAVRQLPPPKPPLNPMPSTGATGNPWGWLFPWAKTGNPA